ncbi:MAG: hypothetical protein LBU72_06660 [Burkholderiaceae bacterium]|jgi:hypothetical protein|nr:hypothetical protein [Burkholderiaceae bacterium]
MIDKCSNYRSKNASCQALTRLRIKKMLQPSKIFVRIRAIVARHGSSCQRDVPPAALASASRLSALRGRWRNIPLRCASRINIQFF